MPTNEERYKLNSNIGRTLLNKFNKIQSDRADNSASDWVSNNSTRHSGSFSDNNPYFTQLDRAGSKADEDALFELAVKWEAEQSGYLQERADKYADLLEQRAYDDPSAQVARQRRAGINPDIAGSAGAGSAGAGSSATAQMPSFETPIENSSKFSNTYDRTSLLLNGFNVASSLVSGVSGFASTIINGISTLSMLPIQKEAGELANQLTRDLNPITVDFAKSNLRGTQIANESAELGLINSTLSTLNSLSNFITPDTTDEDATGILQSLGISDDRIPSLIQGSKQWHSNPLYKATYEANKRQALANEEYNSVYTSDVIHGMLAVGQQIESLEQNLTFVTDDLKLKVGNLLNTDEYAQLVAENTILGTSLSTQQYGYDSKQLELFRSQLDRDFVAFENQLDFLVKAEQQSNSFIQEIRNKAFRENRSLTGAEKALVDVEYQKIHALHSLGSRFLSDAQSFVTSTIQNRYYHRANMNKGSLTYDWANSTSLNFMNSNLNFKSLTEGTSSSQDAANMLKDGLIEALKFAF